MQAQRITAILMDEHRAIERMLDVVSAAATRLERGEPVPPSLFADAGAFFANFADRCHHAKEEKQLFVTMERRGVPVEGGPIGVMLQEHEQGRGYVRIMRAEGQAYAEGRLRDPQLLVDAVRGYVDLLRQHILKEDRILYPLADRLLSAEDQRALVEAAERIEREEMGAGAHERWHALIEDLERVTAAA
jgi:hemerythrin-like domain-containing protein